MKKIIENSFRSSLALILGCVSISLVFGLTISCSQQGDRDIRNHAAISAEDQKLIQNASSIFGTLPDAVENPANPLNPDKLLLGKMLFYDTRLSRSNTISCNSCHNLATYGVDNNQTAMGHGWRRGPVNSPTVLNAAIQTDQFWDGRVADVEEQAMGPIMNPIEMGGPGSDAHEVGVERIASIPEYVALFKKAFPADSNGVTLVNIGKAIGAFERTLMTPSDFDKFLEGKADALSEQAKRGLEEFINAGCITCHGGPALGGQMFQKFGLANGPYWEYTKSDDRNTGRYGVTEEESDKYVFKVPILRNVAHTYPYFHDGNIWDLGEAVRIMGITQLNKELSDRQVDDIVAFLHTLTGEVKADWRTLPVLPPVPPAAPKPDDEVNDAS